MPSTRLIAVFAVACINLSVAAAIAIPTAAWVNFLWDELAHVVYKNLLDCLPELDRPPYSLGILALIAVSRARPLANAYSAVHLPPLQHASL